MTSPCLRGKQPHPCSPLHTCRLTRALTTSTRALSQTHWASHTPSRMISRSHSHSITAGLGAACAATGSRTHSRSCRQTQAHCGTEQRTSLHGSNILGACAMSGLSEVGQTPFALGRGVGWGGAGAGQVGGVEWGTPDPSTCLGRPVRPKKGERPRRKRVVVNLPCTHRGALGRSSGDQGGSMAREWWTPELDLEMRGR